LSKKIKVLFFTVLLLGIFVNYSISEEQKNGAAEKYFTQALVAYNQGNLLGSLDYLLQSLGEESYQPRVNAMIKEVTRKIVDQEVNNLYLIGVDNYKKRNYVKAYSKFNEAHSLAPNNKDITDYLNKSRVSFLAEVNKKQKFLNMSFAGRLVFLGDERFDKKEYLKALDYYNQVISSKDSNWFRNMQAKSRIKKIDKLMTNMIERREMYALEDYHYARAYKFYSANKISDAVQEWEKVYAINPDYAEVKQYLDTYRGAKMDVETKRKLAAQITDLFNKGLDAFMKGDYESAVSLFEKVLELDPNNVQAKQSLQDSRIKLEQQRLEKESKKKSVSSEEDMSKLTKQQKDELIKSLYNKGLTAYAVGDFNEAIRLWQEILKYEPTNKLALKNLARAQQDLKSKKK
jgi:tetratricopeptide (TPR) repeat protein